MANSFSFVENIIFSSGSTIFILFYIPPNTPRDEISLCFETTTDYVLEYQNVNPSHNIIILGDFNKASTNDLCNNLNLKDIVISNTRKKAILDHCFVSRGLLPNFTSKVNAPLSNSDHNSVYIYYTKKPKTNTIKKTFLDLRSSHINKFLKQLHHTDWKPFYESTDVDTKVKLYCEALQTSMNSIPTHTIKVSSKDKKWITPLCIHLINQRWKAFRNNDEILYKHYQEKARAEIVKAKTIWVKSCKREKIGLWSMVQKSAPKASSSIETLRNEFESTASLANRINDELVKSFTPRYNAPDVSKTPVAHNMLITEQEMVNLLHTIKPQKAPGSDGIPNALLKAASNVIAHPLCDIFNNILQTQSYPHLWKIGDVVPIPKTKPIEISKLRPITLLPTSSKLFERFLLSAIGPIILPHIHPNQYGFMPKSSTTICLIQMQETISKLLDLSSTSAVSVITFDFTRAFDSIPHVVIAKKLISLLPPHFYRIIINYLTNRFQQVKVKDTRSKLLPVTSGVPQGGILSPILFNIFINDLDLGTDCFTFKYADDTTIVLPHNMSTTSNDAEALIALKILRMEKWCEENGITLNVSKTQIMTIRKSRRIRFVCHQQDLKILGTIFNSNFKWDSQVNYLIKKASRNIYLLRNLKKFLSKWDLKVVYTSMIESIINYCGVLYPTLPIDLSNKLDKLSKRCHYIICNQSCQCDLITPPSVLRIRTGVKLFLKASEDPSHPLHNTIPKKMQFSGKFEQPISLSERRRKCFIPAITPFVNSFI